MEVLTRNHTRSRLGRLLSAVVLFVSLFTNAVIPVRPVNAADHLNFVLSGPFLQTVVSSIDIRTVAMADFNLDGKNDLATVNPGNNMLSVWLGNGDGTIGPATLIANGSVNHWGLAAGDINLDGRPDLVVSIPTISLHYIGVFLGNGNGTFSTLTTYSTGANTQPKGITIADFNEDGKPDVGVANDAAFTLMKGNGNGSFQTAVSFPMGGNDAYNLAVGDFNGDHHLDVATSNHASGTVGVLLGDGAGNFGVPTTYPAGGLTPTAVAAGDFDNDQILDLAVVQDSNSIHTLEILKGNGDGTFTVQPVIPIGFVYPKSIVAADFDLDGNTDLAVGIGYLPNILTFKGNGNLTFTGPVSVPIGTVNPNWSSLVVGDMNGDLVPDIVVANYNANAISVLLNTAPVISATVNPAPNAYGWYNTPATVTFACTALLGVASLTPATALTLEGANQNVSGVCTDSAGNTDSKTVTGINIDLTNPVLTGAPTTSPNANGWYNSDVTLHWLCSDLLSGIAGSCPVDSLVTGEGDALQGSASVADYAGNQTTTIITPVKIDSTPPTLSPSVSPSTIPLNGSATVAANAFDALSGLDSQACDAIDTTTAGTKTVTCTATDKAGNSASASASYTVSAGTSFAFTGFFPPVDNLPTINLVKAGSAIPVKFSLGGDQGLNIFAVGYPISQQVSCSSTAPIDVIETTVVASANSLSYDPITDVYNYVWKTEKQWAGTCRQFTIQFTDGTQQIVQFKLK